MIHFFRDVLDGPIYIALVVICIFGIIGILGFMMERLKTKEEDSAVRNVDASGLHQSTKLVLSSDSLASREEDKKEEIELLQETTDQSNLESNQEEGMDLSKQELPIQENNPISIIDPDASSLQRDEVLSISSSNVKVEEMADVSEQPQEAKVKDMAPVIDFGTTDDVDINDG